MEEINIHNCGQADFCFQERYYFHNHLMIVRISDDKEICFQIFNLSDPQGTALNETTIFIDCQKCSFHLTHLSNERFAILIIKDSVLIQVITGNNNDYQVQSVDLSDQNLYLSLAYSTNRTLAEESLVHLLCLDELSAFDDEIGQTVTISLENISNIYLRSVLEELLSWRESYSIEISFA